MIQYLIGAGIGYLVSELVRSEKSEKKEESADGFFVFLRADGLGKATLSFYDYKSAKNFYSKAVTSKKVKYGDIIKFSESEKNLYNQWKSEGNIGKAGYPKSLLQQYKLEEIVFGKGNTEFESKEF
jgi:hypothetical protein